MAQIEANPIVPLRKKDLYPESKRFVLSVLSVVTVLGIITGLLAYVIDPNGYFRKPKYDTFYNEAYSTAGFIKNDPAQVAIIGSSMMQNTDLDLVEKKFNLDTVKYTRSGMNVEETCMLINQATSVKQNKIQKFIINLDLTTFNSMPKSAYEKFPEYLYNKNPIDDVKYLLGHETWTKFIPFAVIYNTAENVHNPYTNIIVSKFEKTTNEKFIGNWSFNTTFDANIVKEKYLSNIDPISDQDKSGMLARMENKLNAELFPIVKKNINKQFIFILPPYSALTWVDFERKGSSNAVYSFKRYLVSRLTELKNVTIYDFQDYDGIENLNNYKDLTHYSPAYNDMMVENIGNSKFIVNSSNIEGKISNLKKRVEHFKKQNSSWLK